MASTSASRITAAALRFPLTTHLNHPHAQHLSVPPSPLMYRLCSSQMSISPPGLPTQRAVASQRRRQFPKTEARSGRPLPPGCYLFHHYDICRCHHIKNQLFIVIIAATFLNNFSCRHSDSMTGTKSSVRSMSASRQSSESSRSISVGNRQTEVGNRSSSVGNRQTEARSSLRSSSGTRKAEVSKSSSTARQDFSRSSSGTRVGDSVSGSRSSLRSSSATRHSELSQSSSYSSRQVSTNHVTNICC